MGARARDSELSTIQRTSVALASDYVAKRVAIEGFIVNVGSRPIVPLPLSDAMFMMCDLFEQKFDNRYITRLKNACLGVNTKDMDMCIFFSALDSIFSSGISWSRIVAMYAFGGSVAVAYARQGHQEMITSVPEWIRLYMRRAITQWIFANGGWDSFIVFSRNVLNGNCEENGKKDSAAVYLGISVLFAVVAYYTYRRLRG